MCYKITQYLYGVFYGVKNTYKNIGFFTPYTHKYR